RTGQSVRPGVGLPPRAVVQHFCGKDAFIRGHVVGPLALDAFVRGCFDAARKSGNDRAGDLVLDGEDILQLAVVAFGPDVPISLRIDQLHGDTDAITDLAHAAFEDILDAELACDLLHLYGFALVHEGRV